MMGRANIERPIASVPPPVFWLVTVGFLLQLIWHGLHPVTTPQAEDLPAPPEISSLRLASMGDPLVLSKLLMLWLQIFDNQPGVSIPFQALDYSRIESWLERILALDPRGQYPLLAASRLYGEVSDPVRQRRMLDFVYEKFQEDPARRWPWLAHGVIVAKYQLKDNILALKYARAIADNPFRGEIPQWAQQMQIFVLEDMGELESARLLIGGLLDSGQITDSHELRFLNGRLKLIENKQKIKSRE